MKTIVKFIILFLLISFSDANAQMISWGVDVGISTSSVKIQNVKNSFTESVSGTGVLSYEFGPVIKVGAGPLYGKGKVLLVYQTGDLKYTMSTQEQNIKFSSNKLLIPLLGGYKILPPVLNIEAGLVYSHILSVTKYFNDQTIDVQPMGIGYRVGLNATIKILSLTVCYQGVRNSSSSTLSSFESPDQIIFEAGIKF